MRELLQPHLCYSPEAIRAFLRYSRRQSDDQIHTHLPRTGSCAEHINTVLFPEWLKRDTLISFCDNVANSRAQTDEPPSIVKPPSSDDEPTADTTPKIDPRLDPYGARDYGKVDPTPEDNIRQWVENEKSIERIVREGSVNLLASKCGSFATRPESFVNAYEHGVRSLR